MRRIVLAAALAATGFLGSCGIAGERPEGYEKRDFIVDPGIRFRPTSLREIVGNPQQDAEVKFDALLNKRDETIWQAYYTPFRPGEFKSFSVWPIDAAVWDPRGRGRSIATLYVAADSPEIADLYAMERYTPVRIANLDVAEYVIILKHPDHGTHQVTLTEKDLESGKTYWITGSMAEKSTIKLTPK